MIKRKICGWFIKDSGAAATEFALVFPLLFAMMVGIWDVGNGILVNQKVINASNIVANLIGRQESIDDAELAMAFQAGSLALSPFDTTNLVIDVTSVTFDEDDAPELVWQEDSDGGTGSTALVANATGLGTDGGGALIVETRYEYEPLFAGVAINAISMRERFFTRGRDSAVITRD